MKVNVTFVIRDLDGVPFRDAEMKSTDGRVLRPERDFTLRKACAEALQAPNLTGDTQDGEEKLKRYRLAVKITTDDTPDLSAEEITKLKHLIGLAFGSVVVGRCYAVLDPSEDKPA